MLVPFYVEINGNVQTEATESVTNVQNFKNYVLQSLNVQ